MNSQQFLLVGNDSYLNRGCEAIVRGTLPILDAAFGQDLRCLVGSIGDEQCVRAQAAAEQEDRLSHFRLTTKGKFCLDYVKHQLRKRLKLPVHPNLHRLPREARSCRAALEVGGDNYTIEHGVPTAFLQLDEELMRLGLPLVLWGATVGPFDQDPEVEKMFARHLAKFLVIYAREHRTFEYLLKLGLENVVHVADPAFLMAPAPVQAALPAAFVGLNFSPLTARSATGGDLEAWVRLCGEASRQVAKQTGLPVLLIPHVFIKDPGNNDADFLARVAAGADLKDRVTVLPGEPGAAELKWIISRATVFAGARTHTTIAALSTGVPTLCLAYSMKAWGISEDVFGHSEYCLSVADVARHPKILAERLLLLLSNQGVVRQHLQEAAPRLRAKALSAGLDLKERLGRA